MYHLASFPMNTTIIYFIVILLLVLVFFIIRIGNGAVVYFTLSREEIKKMVSFGEICE